MIPPLKTAAVSLLLGYAATAGAAVVLPVGHTIDWLSYASSGSALLGREGGQVAGVSLQVTQGNAFEGSLSTTVLDRDYWQNEVPFEASGGVDGLRVQVLSGSTATGFSVMLQAAAGGFFDGGVLILGGLDAGSASQLEISFNQAGPGQSVGSLSYLGTASWDPGFGAFEHPFAFDSLSATLSSAPGSEGETSFAFFQLPNGNIDQLSVKFSGDAANPFGDAFVMGFGIVTIPEPSSALIAAVGLAGCFAARRRQRG